MNAISDVKNYTPDALRRARATAHKAAQMVTKAARANLPAATDDSHSNLGWNVTQQSLLSQPLGEGPQRYFAGLSISPLKLIFLQDDRIQAEINLDNVSPYDADVWLDQQLDEAGLRPGSGIELPYALPDDVAAVDVFRTGEGDKGLSAWFGLAHAVLTGLEKDKASIDPGPSPVRCWPHHFDIATYVSLEVGDAETARGIGVGMSPGDEGYDQPYFYINPWPHLDPNDLPALPAPGHWHVEGYVGAIATAEEILSLGEKGDQLHAFIDGAFAIGFEKLGFGAR